MSDEAKQILWNKYGVDESVMNKALSLIGRKKIDFGDIFCQRVVSESFALEEGIVKGGSYDIIAGVGVRAVLGEKEGLAFADSLTPEAIMECAGAVKSIGEGSSSFEVKLKDPVSFKPLYVSDNPIESLERREKAAILERLDKLARQKDPRVVQVMASLSAEHSVMIVCDTDGRLCSDIKPIVQLSLTVIMQNGQRRERGFASNGGAFLFDELIKEHTLEELAEEAVRTASVNLEAIEAPAGTMNVVLGAGWPGVLVHEAVGHGLEADFIRTKTSAFTGKFGQQVASPACTIVDDGTLPKRRGSVSCDDEGTAPQCLTLIEKGVLVDCMKDRKNAALMGAKSTGNGRRESYQSKPLPRMTNTYMLPGDYDKDEIIASVKKGIYAVNFAGGQVDTTSGRFVFSASESYLIENGRITAPIKGATLIGNGPETMQKVSMVGNDLKFDQGIGMCGKAGQQIPVGIGQPTLKVDALTVGGSETGA